MSENRTSPEHQIPEIALRRSIDAAHHDFLARVPQYDATIWQPKDAIKQRAGSCMAELLYVAAGLVNNGILAPDDISVGFNKEKHGQLVPVGSFGRTKPFYAHTFMVVTFNNGKVYQAGFRENRADETPTLEALRADDDVLMDERLFVGTIDQAIETYGAALGVDPSSISPFEKILALERGEEPDEHGPQVRFDEQF